MSAPAQVLAHECRVFTAFLVGAKPTPYVIAAYVEAHSKVRALADGNRFERLLVRIARTHSALTRVADMYARWFAPRSLLRNKLVLLLAILETTGPFCRMIDHLNAKRPVLVFADVLVHSLTAVAALIIGVVCLLPLQLLLSGPNDDPDQ